MNRDRPSSEHRAADHVPAAVDEVDASEMFWPAVRRRYQQDITYSASDYVDVLATYSDHHTLATEDQQGLLANISELIDRTYGGTITKRYLSSYGMPGDRISHSARSVTGHRSANALSSTRSRAHSCERGRSVCTGRVLVIRQPNCVANVQLNL